MSTMVVSGPAAELMRATVKGRLAAGRIKALADAENMMTIRNRNWEWTVFMEHKENSGG